MTNEFPFRPTMRKLYWQDIRNDVNKVAPDFAKKIDEIDPGKDFPLYEACYPYGAMIVKNGVCHYPNRDGKLVTLDNSSLPKDMQQDLSYAEFKIPVGILLRNSLEIYKNIKLQTAPQALFKAGYIFALWGYLGKQNSFHPPKVFSITSGARSFFLLPNIGDASYHKNLRRELGIRSTPPKDLLSQWELFTTLANHPSVESNWHTKLLFFSKKWITKFLSDDEKWLKINNQLLRTCWEDSAFLRNKLLYDYAYSQIQSVRNLRPNPYLADTAKHILTIALGIFPGFAPAIDNSAAPVDILEKVFLDIYRIKYYLPTFMQPFYFSPTKQSRPVYYSLIFPTTLEFSPHSRKVHTNLFDMRELAYLMDIYLEEIQKEYLRIDDTPIAMIPKTTEFTYYHDKKDQEGRARLTSEMQLSDPSLMHCSYPSRDRIFPVAAPFIRGCIKISTRDS